MKRYPLRQLVVTALMTTLCQTPLVADQTAPPATAAVGADESAALIGAAALRLMELVNPPADGVAQVLALELEVAASEGVPDALVGRKFSVQLQAPERLKVTTELDGVEITFGRNGDELWIDVPSKRFGVIGKAEVPRFKADSRSVQAVALDRIALPIQRDHLILLPALVGFQSQLAEVDGRSARIITATPTAEAVQASMLPPLTLELTIPEGEMVPSQLAVEADGKTMRFHLQRSRIVMPMPPAADWDLPLREGHTVEEVALSHLTSFLESFSKLLQQRIEPLGPATGSRTLVATEGKGRLELHDGTRVLYLAGAPEEIGRQHGVLLRNEVHELTSRILYGVGVGSSFAKGRWFFAEIEEAQARLEPFMEDRYLREMDALAEAAELHRQEVRLANFFPELFHCSGFALHGTATVDGAMLHGRILDYLKGMGLEQNAVVMVIQPDEGHAWVNCGYAGFTGSVTAMNEKHLAIGEMGGRGEGSWDGKPMAQLVREAMEKASTLEEAVDVFRNAPRTCEYYYIISDGKTGKACGIKATPESFEVIGSGESHPELPSSIEDGVLLSAGDRYIELVRRVEAGHGKFTPASARDLMTKPVCMGSNIQSVLFAPATLDFWVANADSDNVASHTRYTHYNLRELLDAPPAN